MKDALGHGSNGKGGALGSLNRTDVGMFGASAAHRTLKSNSEAAAELAKGNPKAAAAPVHSAMVGGAFAYDGKDDHGLEATELRDGSYAVRPKGQLGTMGFHPQPWTVKYVKARNPMDAVRKAMVRK